MKKAFTLIELLVVIAIIAILAAILFPVFAQAKNAAKKTAALSNCKQNATAVLMYNTDYDDNFAQSVYQMSGNGIVTPGSGQRVFSVFDALMPYTKNDQIYTSPGDPKAIQWRADVLTPVGLQTADRLEFASFAPNFAVFEDPAVGPCTYLTPCTGNNGGDNVINEGSLPDPVNTALFFDARFMKFTSPAPNTDVPASGEPGYDAFYATAPYNYRQPAAGLNAQRFPGTARYNDVLIVNFADGHAKAINKKAQIPGTAPTGYGAGETAIRNVYRLPFDVNGIPEVVSEGRP
jgi:prepilin-type N-terminal cleavage/methylation domain-containing protein